jgi:hypothetical protein
LTCGQGKLLKICLKGRTTKIIAGIGKDKVLPFRQA